MHSDLQGVCLTTIFVCCILSLCDDHGLVKSLKVLFSPAMRISNIEVVVFM